MLGAIRQSEAADRITTLFARTSLRECLVVDDDRRVVARIDHVEWRDFCRDNFEGERSIASLIPVLDAAREGGAPLSTSDRFRAIEPSLSDGMLADLAIEPVRRTPPPPAAVGLVMAGGLGSRLGALTLDTPKPMIEVAGRPVSEHLVRNLADNGVSDIFMSVRYLAERVMDHYGAGDAHDARIRYLEEQRPLGTAGCLSLLPELDRPLVVVNGDVVTDLQFGRLLDYHEATGNDVTMSVRPHRVRVPFGVVQHSGGRITGIQEKPTLTYLVNAAIYVLSPEVVASVPTGRRVDMPAVVDAAIRRGMRVGTFALTETWIDIGSLDDLHHARTTYDPTLRPAMTRTAETADAIRVAA